LYTQCSHCETVFQLNAETLRAAGGQVRCGRCGEVFNALARLAEDASAFAPPGESAAGGEASPRESPLEMEARADEILHSPPQKRPAEPAAASDGEDFASGNVEFARLQLLEKFKPSRQDTPAPPRHLVPPVAAPAAPTREAKPKAQAGAAPASATDSGKRATRDVTPAPTPPRVPAPTPAAASPDDGALEFTLPPGELDRVFVDPTVARARTAGPADSEAAATALDAEQTGEPMGGLDVAEDARRDVLAGLRRRPFEEPGEPAEPAMQFAWGGAAAVLTLTLFGQIIHENRAWLATHGPLRGALQTLYAALGVKVQPPVNLSAYQLRQWGVTGDPTAAGTLRLRASILNTSALLQPYPLLRVTLANRFGTHVGARDFEPAEYLGRPIARLMTPGERADATLDIQDPGKDAEGFEIDVCLRGPGPTIACAADAATQSSAAGASQAKP